MPKKQTPETAEKQAIKQYLDLKNYFHFPLLQGLASFKGLPDRIAIRGGKVYAIEVKTGRGKQSQHQKDFQLLWESAGGIYIIGGIDSIMRIIK